MARFTSRMARKTHGTQAARERTGEAFGSAPSGTNSATPRRAANLPATLVAAIETIRDNSDIIRQKARHDRVYWLRMGKSWLEVKGNSALDDIGGIKAIRHLLPRSPPYLNKCAIAYDGHLTGDLERGELWCKHTNYSLMNEYEPYLMAEIVEAYRNRRKPRRESHLPLAITAGKLFAKSDRVTIAGLGSAMHGDCRALLVQVPDGVIDFIFLDPPYGVDGVPGRMRKTEHEWDRPLCWDRLWPEIWRVLKPNGTVAVAAMQPLTAELIHAQLQHYIHVEYWLRKATNIYQTRWSPLEVIEEIPIFSRASLEERTYNPQTEPLEKVIERAGRRRSHYLNSIRDMTGISTRVVIREQRSTNLTIPSPSPLDRPRIMHGQKPVNLAKHVVLTYSNPGDVVLDFCAGSMTTGVACYLTGRQFIGIEQYSNHFVLGARRLQALVNSRAATIRDAAD
jgi:site-specific DNA-methyltransferase (adenine-specific)